MKTPIKEMVRAKLKQKGWGVSDNNVREIIKKLLVRICGFLPHGNSKPSEDFLKVVSLGVKVGKVVDALTEMAMNEHDNLKIVHIGCAKELHSSS